MKKIISILILILLVNCSTTSNSTKEEQKPSINNVIEGIKSLSLPKL
jgi:PBP1b-binding outer membrane lipoprotein LpoB